MTELEQAMSAAYAKAFPQSDPLDEKELAVLAGAVLALSGEKDIKAGKEAEALREATALARNLHRKHFPEVSSWKPLPDFRGVLSQIDNMTCDLVRSTPPVAPMRGLHRVNCPHCGWLGIYEEHSSECPRFPNALRKPTPPTAAPETKVEVAQGEQIDRAFDLWFFRELSDEQRLSLIRLALGEKIEKECGPMHGHQRHAIKHIKRNISATAISTLQAEVAGMRHKLAILQTHHLVAGNAPFTEDDIWRLLRQETDRATAAETKTTELQAEVERLTQENAEEVALRVKAIDNMKKAEAEVERLKLQFHLESSHHRRTLARATAAEAQVRELREAFGKAGFIMTKPDDKPKYPNARLLVIGFENGADAHAAHMALISPKEPSDDLLDR